jgi:flagellar biosynthesis protein FlhA
VKKYAGQDNQLTVITLDRAVEDVVVSAIIQNPDDSTSLNIDPEFAQRLLNNIALSMRHFEKTGTQPILLCGSRVRWDLRLLISRFIPGLTVLAFDEIPSEVTTQTLGTVSL